VAKQAITEQACTPDTVQNIISNYVTPLSRTLCGNEHHVLHVIKTRCTHPHPTASHSSLQNPENTLKRTPEQQYISKCNDY